MPLWLPEVCLHAPCTKQRRTGRRALRVRRPDGGGLPSRTCVRVPLRLDQSRLAKRRQFAHSGLEDHPCRVGLPCCFWFGLKDLLRVRVQWVLVATPSFEACP